MNNHPRHSRAGGNHISELQLISAFAEMTVGASEMTVGASEMTVGGVYA